MTRKISLSIFAVSLLTLVLSVSLIVFILNSFFSKKVEQDLAAEAHLAASAIEICGDEYFVSLDTPNRITWISPDGSIINDSKKDASSLGDHSDREEFKEAVEYGTGISRRYSDTLAEKTLNYAIRLEDGSVLRVSSIQNSSLSLFLNAMPYCLIVCMLILLVSAILSRKLSVRIVEPINEIDLGSPEFSTTYFELSPLLHKITRQNELIRNQMTHLKQTAEKFQTITENMSEGMIILDRDKRILSYNPASVRLLGVGNASVGESLLALSENTGFAECVDAALLGNHSKTVFSDSERTYELFVNPVQLEEGNGAVAVILDITDKERGESIRREFTSNISHELKTPLTSIFGISEIMANGLVKDEDIPKFARDIHSETGRLITLVNDIIRLSQLDERRFAEQKEELELVSVAKDAAQPLYQCAAERGVTVTVNGEKATVHGIYSVLYEMIYNLIDNAIKYNSENGTVTVRITPIPHPTITVTDTGIGISAEHLPRIFERFYRVDKSHSRSIGGTGLGLSIVKHAAAYHNAEISIKSELNKGTSVTVEFKNINHTK